MVSFEYLFEYLFEFLKNTILGVLREMVVLNCDNNVHGASAVETFLSNTQPYHSL